jgi:hypothetical protein
MGVSPATGHRVSMITLATAGLASRTMPAANPSRPVRYPTALGYRVHVS